MREKLNLDENKVIGVEHWIHKENIRLFLWEKFNGTPIGKKHTLLFIHGSSMASQPTFDLHVENRPYSSAMNWFALQEFDVWCLDMEGYGHSDKDRDLSFDISNGADDIATACNYIFELRGIDNLYTYGISSGALRASLFAQNNPSMVSRLALDAMVWTGKNSPTLENRRKKLPEFIKSNRRKIDYDFVRSIFLRDHEGSADNNVIDSFAKAICALDDSIPNGTYVDMCKNLPIVNPENISMPTLIMRGQWDGIASMDDLLNFFRLLPNPDKQFKVMPGISHASFQQKNYLMAYQILYDFLTQPEPVFTG